MARGHDHAGGHDHGAHGVSEHTDAKWLAIARSATRSSASSTFARFSTSMPGRSRSGFPALSAPVLVGPDEDCHEARRQLERLLHDDFDIEHPTLQVEHEGGELLSIESSEQRTSRTPARV